MSNLPSESFQLLLNSPVLFAGPPQAPIVPTVIGEAAAPVGADSMVSAAVAAPAAASIPSAPTLAPIGAPAGAVPIAAAPAPSQTGEEVPATEPVSIGAPFATAPVNDSTQVSDATQYDTATALAPGVL